MVRNKTFLRLASCALVALTSATGWANYKSEEKGLQSTIPSDAEVVLFKIHDIKSLKNLNNEVTDCEFNISFYNRSDTYVEGASLLLEWKDEAIEDVINSEEQNNENFARQMSEEGNNFSTQRSQLTTGILVSPSLITNVRVPALQPYRQITLKSKLSSDRCFLMLNEAKYTLTQCLLPNKASGVRSANKEQEQCQNLFRMVSVKDPEYYREFKKVSFNEDRKLQYQMKQRESEELGQIYEKAVSGLSRATDIIGQIR